MAKHPNPPAALDVENTGTNPRDDGIDAVLKRSSFSSARSPLSPRANGGHFAFSLASPSGMTTAGRAGVSGELLADSLNKGLESIASPSPARSSASGASPIEAAEANRELPPQSLRDEKLLHSPLIEVRRRPSAAPAAPLAPFNRNDSLRDSPEPESEPPSAPVQLRDAALLHSPLVEVQRRRPSRAPPLETFDHLTRDDTQHNPVTSLSLDEELSATAELIAASSAPACTPPSAIADADGTAVDAHAEDIVEAEAHVSYQEVDLFQTPRVARDLEQAPSSVKRIVMGIRLLALGAAVALLATIATAASHAAGHTAQSGPAAATSVIGTAEPSAPSFSMALVPAVGRAPPPSSAAWLLRDATAPRYTYTSWCAAALRGGAALTGRLHPSKFAVHSPSPLLPPQQLVVAPPKLLAAPLPASEMPAAPGGRAREVPTVQRDTSPKPHSFSVARVGFSIARTTCVALLAFFAFAVAPGLARGALASLARGGVRLGHRQPAASEAPSRASRAHRSGRAGARLLAQLSDSARELVSASYGSEEAYRIGVSRTAENGGLTITPVRRSRRTGANSGGKGTIKIEAPEGVRIVAE